MMNLPCLRESCPNFLRPIYHTLSASQAPKRGQAPRIKPMPATALVFHLIVTDLLSSTMVLIYSVDAIPPYPSVGLFDNAVRFRLHRLRVSDPEPCPASDAYHQNLGRALEFIAYIQYLCSCLCVYFYRMFDILQQFFRIILSASKL